MSTIQQKMVMIFIANHATAKKTKIREIKLEKKTL